MRDGVIRVYFTSSLADISYVGVGYVADKDCDSPDEHTISAVVVMLHFEVSPNMATRNLSFITTKDKGVSENTNIILTFQPLNPQDLSRHSPCGLESG